MKLSATRTTCPRKAKDPFPMRIIHSGNLTSTLLHLRSTLIFCQLESTVFQLPEVPQSFLRSLHTAASETEERYRILQIDTGVFPVCRLTETFPLSLCFFSRYPASPMAELLHRVGIAGDHLWILDSASLGNDVAAPLLHSCLSLLTANTTMVLVSAHSSAFVLYECADLIYARGDLEALLREHHLSFRPFRSLADFAIDLKRIIRKQLLRQRPTAVAFRERYFSRE